MGVMDWLRRFADRTDRAANFDKARPHQLPANVVRVSGDGRAKVHGEASYQPALRLAANGKEQTGGFDGAIETTTVLVPEPENRYDNQAVRVDVLISENAMTVGYLPAEICGDYQRVLRTHLPADAVAACEGRIMGGGQRYYGIYLHLAEPETLFFANHGPDKAVLLPPEHHVSVSGEKHHLDVLMALTGTDRATRVVAELGWCETRAHQRVVEVRIDGHRVGQLTPAMTARYESLLDAIHTKGESPACEALIKISSRTQLPEVGLRLPKV